MSIFRTFPAICLLCFRSLNAADEPNAQSQGSLLEQTAEAKAFRKTAINVKFPSDGKMLTGWLYKPAGDGPFPVIVWNHGSERMPIAHPELGMFYTKNGFVLFLPVRAGHGRSPEAYITDEADAFAKANTDRDACRTQMVKLHEQHHQSVVDAIAWVRKQPFADAGRIAVTGCSYGGIQTLLTAEDDPPVRACIPFAPGAMSWANMKLQERELEAVRHAKTPLFLIQAKNDYSTGPSDLLGPVIRSKGGINRAVLYPAFGTSPADGHGGFACSEPGIAIWGTDVLAFLKAVGMSP